MNKLDNFIGSERAYQAYKKILSYDNDNAEIAIYNEMVKLFGDGVIHELLLNDYIEYKDFAGIKYIFVKEAKVIMTAQLRFEIFTKELSDISSKYGILITSVGGVNIFEEGELSEVKYSNDSTSGDLHPYSYRIGNE